MNSVIISLLVFLFIAGLSVAEVNVHLNTNALGPVRSCRCYLNHVNQNAQAHTFSTSKSFGPAEICHCLPPVKTAPYPIGATKPASVAMPMTAPVAATAPMHAAFMPNPRSLFTSSSSRSLSCPGGPDIIGKYTVDDTSKLFMCNNFVSYGSYNQLINIDMKETHYPCADFFFELRNEAYSSGLALAIEAYGYKFVAVGSDSPKPPPGVYPLKAYAVWTYGSCENVTPKTEAVYVSTLDGTNDAFKSMVTDYGAYPLGVQNGNVYQNGLQCIRIENPFCSTATR